jgi:hypothetical protein
MAANKFVMKHGQVEVQYTIGETPGLTALLYNDGSVERSFTSAQVRTDATALGSFVSVVLETIVSEPGGSSSEIFGFFLPELDVAPGDSEKFLTAGVQRNLRSPGTVENLPQPLSCIELHGTAQNVGVPLAQAATP